MFVRWSAHVAPETFFTLPIQYRCVLLLRLPSYYVVVLALLIRMWSSVCRLHILSVTRTCTFKRHVQIHRLPSGLTVLLGFLCGHGCVASVSVFPAMYSTHASDLIILSVRCSRLLTGCFLPKPCSSISPVYRSSAKYVHVALDT